MRSILNLCHLFGLMLVPLWAADYYVDADSGDDRSDGRSSETAWQSLEKVNSIVFEPGDRILFASNTTYHGQLAPKGDGKIVGGKMQPIRIDRFGDGELPTIHGGGKADSATLYLHNVEGWEVRNLIITNHEEGQRSRLRYGVRVHNEKHPVARHIVLDGLRIRNVNGAYPKHMDAGAAIRFTQGGKPACRFDQIRVENCQIKDCSRNGIVINGGPLRGPGWNPSTRVVIRHNLIEGVGGDGILPIGCDGPLVEWNIMRDCPRYGQEGDAAAGMWPWNCDNAVFQFNEVSDHKAWVDAQAYDCDYSCRNTLYQYNLSHDNEGGFMLMCSPGKKKDGWLKNNALNEDSIIRYNLSINDGSRTTEGKYRYFSPTFSITGETTKGSEIYRNLIIIPKKSDSKMDRSLVTFGEWGGRSAVDTEFRENIFVLLDDQPGIFKHHPTLRDARFINNHFYGKVTEIPEHPEVATRNNRYGETTPRVVTVSGPRDELKPFHDFLDKKGNPQEKVGIQIKWNITRR